MLKITNERIELR